MQKFSKNSKNLKNLQKNQSISDTVPYCKTMWAGGCWLMQKFYTKLFQKMPFAFILHFLFSKITFLH